MLGEAWWDAGAKPQGCRSEEAGQRHPHQHQNPGYQHLRIYEECGLSCQKVHPHAFFTPSRYTRVKASACTIVTVTEMSSRSPAKNLPQCVQNENEHKKIMISGNFSNTHKW